MKFTLFKTTIHHVYTYIPLDDRRQGSPKKDRKFLIFIRVPLEVCLGERE